MGKNTRRRHEPQRPSASKAHSSPGRQLPYERIPLVDEGFQQLLPVCSPHKAAGRLHTTCVEEDDCDLWCDGKLQDRNYIKSLTFEPWLAADGRWRLKITKGVDAVNTDGSRSFAIDKSARNWEISAAVIAGLRERLIKEQLPAALPPSPPPLRVEVIALPPIQTVAPQPEVPEPPPRQVTAVEWITCEAQWLKRTDKIPVGVKMTPFAKMLATNMEKAARTDRLISISPVGWRHILNHLREWGLWPIDSIK